MNAEKTKLLNEKYELLGEIEPQEMGIKDKFCLNKQTNEFMEKLKKERKNSKIYNKNYKSNSKSIGNSLEIKVYGGENLLNIKEENYTASINNNIIENEMDDIKKDDNESEIKTESKLSSQGNLKITSDSGKLNIITKNFALLSQNKDYSKIPYGQAIEFIKRLNDFKVPLEKLVIIASISSLITECVNKYWKNMERYIQPSMLSIDADELMTIFMYIIYKSHMDELFIHADFIKYFTSPTTKSTMIGYYFTTLQGCLDFLLQIKNKQELARESL